MKLTPSSSDSKQQELLVPFLVTSEKLDYPILGYNLIEELVGQYLDSKITIYKTFLGKDRKKIDALVICTELCCPFTIIHKED